MRNSVEAEQSIIGCLFYDTNNKEIAEDIFLEINDGDFCSEANRIIFSICKALWKNQKPVDFVTVTSLIEVKELYKQVGGITYLTAIMQSVVSNANYKHYINILKARTATRECEAIAADLIERAKDNPFTARDIAMTRLNGLGENGAAELEHIGDAAEEAHEYINDLKSGKKAIEGVSTPYEKLNYVLGGFQKGEITVIAARPGIGKSAIVNEILLHAGKNKKKVALFNLEMSKRQIALRMYANLLNKSMYDLTGGRYDETEVKMAKAKLKELEIYVDVNSHTVEKIARACRVQKKKKGLDLLCIDYLQLVTSADKNESRRVEVDNISRQIKLLAVELDIPVIELCQMNRGVETSDREPALSDLRESGAIEQDASQVIFLHREKAKENGYRQDIDRLLKVIVAKNRNGAVGAKYLKFEADKMRFIEVDDKGQELVRFTPTVAELPF